MKDLDPFDRACERSCGLISGWFVFCLHQLSTAAGSKWDFDDPSTMEIVVTKENADGIYANCKAIGSGYAVGWTRSGMKKVKEAREKAHRYLFEEANDPDTPITRKIELVRLCSR